MAELKSPEADNNNNNKYNSNNNNIKDDVMLDAPQPKRVSSSQPDDIKMRVLHANNTLKNDQLRYPSNIISNTKYTVFNFIFKNFAEQFSLHMNRYFLLIACLQLIRILTPVNPLTTWGPLIVIFLITATREAIDDYHRAVEDRNANEREYTVIKNGVRTKIQSQFIKVGDILYIEENEEFPADLFLLKSSTKNGSIFIQTSNLDGETNYKQRQVLPETVNYDLEQVHRFQGVIECATPNAHVYKFDSRLWLHPSPDLDAPSDNPIAVSGDQLLQQTTKLVNTEWVYGVVVYTGNETKFGKNRGEPPFKLAKVDKFINKIAIAIFVFQLILVIIFGIIGDVLRYGPAVDHWYLDYSKTDEFYHKFIIPIRFLLLNSTMIPISLKVTLDLCKMIYAKFLGEDLGMYDDVTKQKAYAKTTAICEDLGQIEYVLTDKTGTLTQNSMIFKECSVGKKMYSAVECLPNGIFHQRVKRGEDPLDLLVHFCLNNGVVPVKQKDGTYIYKGSSPDEVALVKAAYDYGVKLIYREGKNVTLEVLGKIEKYVILEELHFTSDRRRMSVVVLNNDTKEIKLYVKGADDVVAARTKTKDSVQVGLEHVELFARKGLRTLFFASRMVDSQEFKNWKDEWHKANTVIVNREEALSSVYDKLEMDFVYQGCTAIEDELQVGVADTIHLLREAGIKVWMLTGDKFSTALQIATACNLKSASDEKSALYAIQGDKKDELKQIIDNALEDSANTKKEITVIIRGVTLLQVFKYYRDDFTRLLLRAHSVICCRVTPSQKAELVRLVSDEDKITLAIGDGGNDVAMIQQAHVGVGIRGKEGLQAARAADYTISYFGALERLVLVHGRYAYLRTCLVAQYSFYKSLLFCFIQIGFGFVSYFSGATLFNSLCITIYNAALFVPIVSFVFDKDVDFNTILQYPQLYRDNQQSVQFNFYTFGLWSLRGFIQAYIIFLFTIYSRGLDYHNADGGYGSDWETLGLVAFGAYLWTQAFTMVFELKNLTYVSMIAIWGMHIITFIILIFTNSFIIFDSLNGYWTVFVAMGDGQMWLHNFLCLVACVAPVLAMQAYQVNYYPTVIDHLRYIEKKSKKRVKSIDSHSSLLANAKHSSRNVSLLENSKTSNVRRWSTRYNTKSNAEISVEMKSTPPQN